MDKLQTHMELRRVTPADAAWEQVTSALLAADPVRDLLLVADVASGIARLSRVWLASEAGTALGVAFAFPLWPECPSLGLKGRTPAIEREMASALIRAGDWTRGFVITTPEQVGLFEGLGRMGDCFEERHMVLDAAGWQMAPVDASIRPGTLDELDRFYREHAAGAWHPIQFETGPYLVAEVDGTIVAAAGTHFAYPGLAQIGNVLTAPLHRGRGHAERVTRAVTQALVELGYPHISLFVASDNPSARRIYARIGFEDMRPLAAFRWEAAGLTAES